MRFIREIWARPRRTVSELTSKVSIWQSSFQMPRQTQRDAFQRDKFMPAVVVFVAPRRLLFNFRQIYSIALCLRLRASELVGVFLQFLGNPFTFTARSLRQLPLLLAAIITHPKARFSSCNFVYCYGASWRSFPILLQDFFHTNNFRKRKCYPCMCNHNNCSHCVFTQYWSFVVVWQSLPFDATKDCYSLNYFKILNLTLDTTKRMLSWCYCVL